MPKRSRKKRKISNREIQELGPVGFLAEILPDQSDSDQESEDETSSSTHSTSETQELIPREIQELIFSFLSIQNLIPLQVLSKYHRDLFIHIIMGRAKTTFDHIVKLTLLNPLRLPHFIEGYQNTDAFEELTTHYRENPHTVTPYQALCYALITDEPSTINRFLLRQAINLVEQDLENDENVDEKIKAATKACLLRLKLLSEMTHTTKKFDAIYEAAIDEDVLTLEKKLILKNPLSYHSYSHNNKNGILSPLSLLAAKRKKSAIASIKSVFNSFHINPKEYMGEILEGYAMGYHHDLIEEELKQVEPLEMYYISIATGYIVGGDLHENVSVLLNKNAVNESHLIEAHAIAGNFQKIPQNLDPQTLADCYIKANELKQAKDIIGLDNDNLLVAIFMRKQIEVLHDVPPASIPQLITFIRLNLHDCPLEYFGSKEKILLFISFIDDPESRKIFIKEWMPKQSEPSHAIPSNRSDSLIAFVRPHLPLLALDAREIFINCRMPNSEHSYDLPSDRTDSFSEERMSSSPPVMNKQDKRPAPDKTKKTLLRLASRLNEYFRGNNITYQSIIGIYGESPNDIKGFINDFLVVIEKAHATFKKKLDKLNTSTFFASSPEQRKDKALRLIENYNKKIKKVEISALEREAPTLDFRL